MIFSHKFSHKLNVIESFCDLGRHGESVLQLTVSLVSVLELDPQLPDLHQRQDLWYPLYDEWGRVLLV